MTTKYKEGPLGKVHVLSAGANPTNTDLNGIKQVIGLGLIIDGANIRITGKRWPGDEQFFEVPPTPAELSSYIQAVKSNTIPKQLIERDLLDVQVQGVTLLFLTSNIENFSVRDEVIVGKRNKRFDKYFKPNSIRVSHDGRTVLWRSDYAKKMQKDPYKYAYDILVQLSQEREGDSLELPIIIDPGTQNGGVGGWP